MKKTKKILKTGIALCTAFIISIPTITYAQTSDLLVDINGTTIDVEEVARENGVNPYELKEEIEKGLNEEKASPFSDLVTTIPNTEASESVEYAMARALTKVDKTNQDSTAYVASSGALTASGKTPTIGMCAMHIDVTTKTGNTTSSKVKLGTTIHMENPIYVSGLKYTSFNVEDRGNPSNRTKFWIDIFFGTNNTTNYNVAINYGIKKVSYHYYYN